MGIKDSFMRYFTFSGFSPVLSHGIIFLGGMCLAFDLIHLTVVPMKISSGHVVFAEKSDRVLSSQSELKVGTLLHLEKILGKDGDSRCRISGIWARVTQREGGVILGSDWKNFVNYTELLKGTDKQSIIWTVHSEKVAEVCKDQLSVQYGI